MDKEKHWNRVYETKQADQLSWYQQTPSDSLRLIEQSGIPKNAAIIDIGGGDSFLAEHLLKKGYSDITVLDISSSSIERAKKRLGENAERISWIVCDVTQFVPERQYMLWHDRATFHFLALPGEIEAYRRRLKHALAEDGIFMVGTFSRTGPSSCSGIPVKQYSGEELKETFGSFRQMLTESAEHTTPSGAVQNFVFSCFRQAGQG